jgi:DNA-binding NarL/FixJ family response regulator
MREVYMSKIRTLLVDDHQLFREGMARILSAQPDFEVVGEAGDGLEALIMARGLQPDLILLDVSMPGTDGVEAVTAIKRELPEAIIVMLTIHEEDEILFEALRIGAQGYLLKTTPSKVLLDLLRGTMHGHAAITPALAGRLLDQFRRIEQEDRQHESPPQPVTLTQRELEVLNLVAQGKSDLEIAELLTISIHTVKTHVRNILSKLHLDGRHEAARYALRRELIPPPNDHIT